MTDLCTEIRFVYDDHTAPASVDVCHTPRWLTDVGNDLVRLRYFCSGATIECAPGVQLCTGLPARGCLPEVGAVAPPGHGARLLPEEPEMVTIDIKWREGSPFASPNDEPVITPAERLRHAAQSGEGVAVCALLGRHEFGDSSTCSRCGLIREMLADGVPRRKRRWRPLGPLAGQFDVHPNLEAARNRALDSMGEALRRRRSRE